MTQRLVRSFDSFSVEYFHSFQTFLNHTDQKWKALDRLAGEVEGLAKCDVLIDGGAGNGRLTQWLSNWFLTTVGVEPNETLMKEFKETCPDARFILSPILDAEVEERGDLVLCSHVLYYIPHEEWEENVKKLLGWLGENGKLVFVLQNPNSDGMRMVREFLGGRFSLAEVEASVNQIEGRPYTATLDKVEASVKTSDLETACLIAEFVLNVLPMKNPPSWESLEQYVEENFSLVGGGYMFSCDQDFLVIQHTKDRIRRESKNSQLISS